MPQVNGTAWRDNRARMDLTSDRAAALLKIAGGSLRQIELGRKPASLRLAHRAARLYGCDVNTLIAGNGNEGVPEEPPKQPTQPTGPRPRPDRESRKTGPKRAVSAA